MKKLNLSPEDAQDLIQSYKSDLRKLEFEVERIKSAIEILEKGKRSEAGEAAPRKRGRPRKQVEVVIAEKKTTTGKRGRKPSATKKAENKTSVAKTKNTEKTAAKTSRKKTSEKAVKTGAAKKAETKQAKEKKKATVVKKERKKRTSLVAEAWDNFILNTLKNHGKAMIKSELLEASKASPLAEGMNEKQIGQRLAQSIHKLSNVTKAIAKTFHLGRGHAFALKEWIDKNGNLLPQYQREEKTQA